MAQGLKVGESVTVNKNLSVSPDDPVFAQGLKQIKMGRVGHIVEPGTGRSFVVEFKGKRTLIPSRWLERVESSSDESVDSEPDLQAINVTSSEGSSTATSESTTDRGAELVYQEADVSFRPVEEPAFFTSVSQKPDADLVAAIDYSDRHFVTAVANKLLMSGNDPETLLIQVRFSDLPTKTKNQVQALMHAKLALGPKSTAKSTAKPTADKPGQKRRGRKPRNPSPEV